MGRISRPKNNDNEGTPIVINPNIYNELSHNAKKKNVTIKKYANELLERVLRNQNYLESQFPNISYDKTVGTTVILQDLTDSDKIKPILVELKEGSKGFFCKEDKSEDCDHVVFCMFCPDVVHSGT